MSDRDNNLLARLNALKQSSVSLNPEFRGPVAPRETSEPTSVEDKLAQRLKSLRAGEITPSVRDDSQLQRAGGVAAFTGKAQYDATNGSDPIKDWQQIDTDEQTIEDLLADLGSESQWNLDPDDPKVVSSLLKEARETLQQEREPVHERDGIPAQTVESINETHDDSADGNRSRKTEDEQDEEEADDYVKRILAELESEENDDDQKDQITDANTNPDSSSTNLGLPATPSNALKSSDGTKPPSYEDSELEARFSKLGLNLPSTPTSMPSSKVKSTRNARAKSNSNLPTYTDEDIDSWCCICNEDGEVRCLGCDGDIYCQTCWREGHGSGPGQERGHRAVQYNAKGPAATAQ